MKVNLVEIWPAYPYVIGSDCIKYTTVHVYSGYYIRIQCVPKKVRKYVYCLIAPMVLYTKNIIN